MIRQIIKIEFTKKNLFLHFLFRETYRCKKIIQKEMFSFSNPKTKLYGLVLARLANTIKKSSREVFSFSNCFVCFGIIVFGHSHIKNFLFLLPTLGSSMTTLAVTFWSPPENILFFKLCYSIFLFVKKQKSTHIPWSHRILWP